jgi:Domain of unknown function (DUF4411)
VADDLRSWVVDTSSLIQVRRAGISSARQAAVFRKLTELTKSGLLVFPPQVREELEWGEADNPSDPALAWIQRVKPDAERSANLDTVRQVLARAPLLIDAESTRDQADPYVIALALDSPALGGVSILSDDRRDRHDGQGGLQKLSLATVASLWDIPVVPLAGFVLRFLDSP